MPSKAQGTEEVVRVVAQLSAEISMSAHAPCWTTQSPASFAFWQVSSNFSSHLVSFSVSGAAPLFCALAYTPPLHATFLVTAFVIFESQYDCANATPPAPSPNTTNAKPVRNLA